MFLTINDIKEISSKMSEKIGVDYTGYSINFFRRRITYLIDKFNLHKVQELYALLDDKKSCDQIVHEMMIPTTEMFRDPGFWRVLRKVLAGKSGLTVWLPNITNGFELYSLLVIIAQAGVKDCKIVCNVISPITEEYAKSLRISSKDNETNYSNYERLESGQNYDSYFEIGSDGDIRPKAELLKNVRFVKGWFMNAPKEKYDLILFRNVLLEYGPRLHEKAVERLAESLNDKGLLAIGIKESLITKATSLKPHEEGESIYVK